MCIRDRYGVDLIALCIPSCQSGIGVRAIRMTARIAPTNAAAPMAANTFLLSFFFAALQISAAPVSYTHLSDAKRAAVWCKADTEDSGEDHPGASG